MGCSICGGRTLRAFGGRDEAHCADCDSLERHRALARVFARTFDEGDGRCIEFRPVGPRVFGGYLRERGWDYSAVDREADLTDLGAVADGEADLLIAQHVVEHVPEFERALDEIRRVVADDGVALLEIPHEYALEKSERRSATGDACWRFGRDIERHLAARFESVERFEFNENEYSGAFFRCSSTATSYAEKVAAAWGDPPAQGIRSFWQSPVAIEEINRRLTGLPGVDAAQFFAEHFCDPPRGHALSLGCGGGELELKLAAVACESMLGVDIAAERIRAATERTPAELAGRVQFEVRDLETWTPPGKFDLIVAQDILHHIDDLERWCAMIKRSLTDDGVLYVHDFIGPSRFQWSDRQLMVVNRLLSRLPDRLRRDVVNDDGSLREPAGRPDVDRFVAEDPSEAIDPQGIPRLLESYLKPVHVHSYGGGLYHQYFNRIMGNFDNDPDLVRTVMEIDFILTDLGAIEPDYLWGVYRL